MTSYTHHLKQAVEPISMFVFRPIGRFLTDGGSQYAGNVAFFTFLALFPFMIFLTTLAAFFEDTEAAQRFVDYLLASVPPFVGQALEPIIGDVTAQASGSILTASILGTLWISASAIEALRAGLNRAYRVSRPRSFIFHRLQGMMFVILGSASILLAMTLLILVPVALSYLPLEDVTRDQIEALLPLGRYVAVPAIMISTGVIFYRFLPNADHGWRNVLPGAVLSFLIWLLLVELFSAYVRNFDSFSVIYGGLGGIIAILMFLYLTAGAFLLGAEFNVVLEEHFGGTRYKRRTRGSHDG